MPKNDTATIDAYIAAQPAAARPALAKMRRVIGKAIPAADEAISYGMPAYTLGGRVVVYFAGWKQHTALYPGSAQTFAAFGKDVAGYATQQRHAAVSPRRATARQADRRHRQTPRQGGVRGQQGAPDAEEGGCREEGSPSGKA